MSDQGEHSRVISFGKHSATLYPEVYNQFVFTLYREHDDIVRAMVIAQVTLSDGSALDFLNMILGTSVDKFTPMEIGYAELLDALKMRIRSPIAEARTMEVARNQFKEMTLGYARPEHEQGTPLFPQYDDKGKPV